MLNKFLSLTMDELNSGLITWGVFHNSLLSSSSKYDFRIFFNELFLLTYKFLMMVTCCQFNLSENKDLNVLWTS